MFYRPLRMTRSMLDPMEIEHLIRAADNGRQLVLASGEDFSAGFSDAET